MNGPNDDLEERVEELERRMAEIEEEISSEGVSISRNNIQEFVDEVDPDAHTDITLAIGFYTEEVEEQDNFDIADIKDGYDRSRRNLPGNLSDVLRRLGERGLLIKDGESNNKHMWKLSTDGQSRIAEEIE